MKKLFIALFICLFITSCGGGDHIGTTKSGKNKWDIICIDNVEYLIKTGGYSGYMSPHLKTDGKPYLCNSLKES